MKFLTAFLIAVLWVAVAVAADDPKPHSPTPPCPNCQCGCTVTGACKCKDCDHPLLVKTQAALPAKTEEVKCCPADDSGMAFFDKTTGNQCGWLDKKTLTYWALTDHNTFVKAASIPSTATTTKPVFQVTAPTATYFDGSFGASSGCANGSCGGSSGTGLFRRR